jgi:hypothetical protein
MHFEMNTKQRPIQKQRNMRLSVGKNWWNYPYRLTNLVSNVGHWLRFDIQ